MKYLITGNTGSGKSTVAKQLAALGKTAIDTDTNGYSHWYEYSTGKVFKSRPKKTPDWQKQYEWLWNEPEIQRILFNNKRKDIFICGIASNQVKFYSSFDKTFLLYLDPETMSQRLLSRKNNPFGERPSDIKAALMRHEHLNNRILKAGAIKINATKPIEKVVDEILRYTHEN
jgi:dephospho-CoA kinase